RADGARYIAAPLPAARDVDHAVHGAGSRTRRSPQVEQVEPRLAVNGDQPLQQAVARLDGRPGGRALAGLVPPALVGIAAPGRGEPVLLPEPAPLKSQPRLSHAEAAGDGGTRLGVVPQGDELRVVGLVHEHVTSSGLRSRTVAG